MVKINWTPLSIQDLHEIYDFIADGSKRYANITVNKIYLSVQSITKQPLIGRIVPEIDNKNIREIITGNYRIIYRVIDDNHVDIL